MGLDRSCEDSGFPCPTQPLINNKRKTSDSEGASEAGVEDTGIPDLLDTAPMVQNFSRKNLFSHLSFDVGLGVSSPHH